MIRHTTISILTVLLSAASIIADPPATRPNTDEQPAALKRPDSGAPQELAGVDVLGQAGPGEHPLMPALRWARQDLPAIEAWKDYSATFVKREQVAGELGKHQSFFIKIRQQPFSIYTRGLAPAAIRGQETIYVAGRNEGKLWVHPAGVHGRLVHAVLLKPDGALAMREQRYPITEIGIVNMVKHLIAVANEDLKHGECEASLTTAKVNDRVCSCFQVVHPVPRSFFQFHVARIFVDNELKIPTRYEAYAWPSKPGDPPGLLEEYSYLDMKLNNGFREEDFSITNPAYHFR
jgi:hypothetical protein